MGSGYHYPSVARRAAKAAILDGATSSSWPFTSRIENVLGLHAKTGTWARVTGRFRILLEIDTNLFVTAPSMLREFVLYHEAVHVAERHGLQQAILRLLLWGGAALIVALSPSLVVAFWVLPVFAVGGLFCEAVLRAWQEMRGDLGAAESMSAERFAKGLFMSWSRPRRGILGVFDRIVYGSTPYERARRAGVSVDFV